MALHPDRKRPFLKQLAFNRKRWFLKDYGPGQGWQVGTPVLAAGYRAPGQPLRLAASPLITSTAEDGTVSYDIDASRITVQ